MVIRVDQRPRRARGLELLLGQSANRLHGDVAGVPEGAGVEHALEHAEALPDQLPRLELKVGGGRGALGLHGSMLLVRVHGVAAPIKRVRRSAMRSSESAPDRRSQCYRLAESGLYLPGSQESRGGPYRPSFVVVPIDNSLYLLDAAGWRRQPKAG